MPDNTRRPFLAMAVIWGSLLLALVAIAPTVAGFVMDDLGTPVSTPAPTAEATTDAQAMAEARVVAERRRQAAMAPPTVAPERELRIAVRSNTLGRAY